MPRLQERAERGLPPALGRGRRSLYLTQSVHLEHGQKSVGEPLHSSTSHEVALGDRLAPMTRDLESPFFFDRT
jgi:hypothetical protein